MVRINCVQLHISPAAPLKQRINLEHLANLLVKKTNRGYIVFKFHEYTFKLSRNYQITVFVKKDIIRTLENLHKTVYYFVKYIHQLSGVSISKFDSHIRNVQGSDTHSLSDFNVERFVTFVTSKELFRTYKPPNTEKTLLFVLYCDHGYLQIRSKSVRFISKTLSDFCILSEYFQNRLSQWQRSI